MYESPDIMSQVNLEIVMILDLLGNGLPRGRILRVEASKNLHAQKWKEKFRPKAVLDRQINTDGIACDVRDPSPISMYCRVGDMMRFGQSSRMFILGGPPEFMPEEGLSREERHRLAAMEVFRVLAKLTSSLYWQCDLQSYAKFMSLAFPKEPYILQPCL